jgi:hypothetical protein
MLQQLAKHSDAQALWAGCSGLACLGRCLFDILFCCVVFEVLICWW